MREATTPGYFSLLRQRKSNQKEKRPARAPPYGRYPVLLASPGRSRTRRAQTTRFGLDQRSRTPPGKAPVLGSLHGAQLQPRPNTAPTLTLPRNAGEGTGGGHVRFRHCERSEAISVVFRDCFVATLLAMTGKVLRVEVGILRGPLWRARDRLPNAGSPKGDDEGSSSVAIRYRDIPYGDLGA